MTHEKEFKFHLAREEYAQLITSLRLYKSAQKVMLNNYYDTPGLLLDKAGCTVRLRIYVTEERLASKAVIDFKGNARKEGHLRISEEINYSIPLIGLTPLSFFGKYQCLYTVEQMGDIWPRISPITYEHPVWLLGGIRVIRDLYIYKGLTLELDEIDFDVALSEYELECETEQPDGAYEIIRYLLLENHIEPIISQCGKRRRFFDLRAQHPHVGHTYNVLNSK